MLRFAEKYSNQLVSLLVITCIIATYLCENKAEGVKYFERQVIPSTIFVSVLFLAYQFKETFYLIPIILIEFLSTITNLIAGFQYSMAHKTAYIYAAYGDIMSAMFIAELAIIGLVIIRDGYSKRDDILRLLANHSRPSSLSILSSREMPPCKIP